MGELSDKQSRMQDTMEGITIGTRRWTRPTVCDSEMAARVGIPPEIQHKEYASERELRLDLDQVEQTVKTLSRGAFPCMESPLRL
jgi:hypothetical protein